MNRSVDSRPVAAGLASGARYTSADGGAPAQLLAQRAGEALQRALRDALVGRARSASGVVPTTTTRAQGPSCAAAGVKNSCSAFSPAGVGDAGGVEHQPAERVGPAAAQVVAHQVVVLSSAARSGSTTRPSPPISSEPGQRRVARSVPAQRLGLRNAKLLGQERAGAGVDNLREQIGRGLGWPLGLTFRVRGRTYFRVRTVGSIACEARYPKTNPDDRRRRRDSGPCQCQTRPRRRVAVLGGNRIPVRVGPTALTPRRPTRTCSPRRWAGWSTGSAWRGERLGAVVGGAVLKHSRDFNLMRECVLGQRAVAVHAGLRSAAGLRHRPAGGDRRRRRHRRRPLRGGRRRRRGHHLRRTDRAGRRPAPHPAEAAPGQVQRAPAEAGRHAARQPGRRDPDQRRTAHRPVDGRARRHHRQGDGRSNASTRTSWPWPATATWPPPTTAASSTTWSRPFLGLYRDDNLRPDSSVGEAGQAQAGLRGEGRRRDHDRRQLDSADRRRLGGAAGQRGVGGRSLAGAAGLLRRRARRPRSTTSTAATAC